MIKHVCEFNKPVFPWWSTVDQTGFNDWYEIGISYNETIKEINPKTFNQTRWK